MNKKLLDILVCPFDKVTSLELLEFQSAYEPRDTFKESPRPATDMDQVQELKEVKVSATTNPVNDEANGSENKKYEDVVSEGLLLCKSCLRFYPITEEIPIILPDELRDKKKDIEFLKKWKESIPNELLISLKPWTL